MKDKYVLDSSIWVEIHRGNPRIIERVQPILEKNQVCLVDVIIAEILRGARTEQDFRRLGKAFSDFPQIHTTWSTVSRLAFQVARKGFSPPLIDLYIAQAVRETNRTLITQDRHFTQIAAVNGLSFEFIKVSDKQ